MSRLGRGQLLHLRLFIEGIEVPVIGAMVSASEGAPAAAQIELVPTDSAMRLKPRTRVELFFLDYDESYIAADGDERSELQASVESSKGIPDAAYKLLYSGELFTIMYTKSGPGSRSVILQCLDMSNLWDTSYLYMLRYADTQGESAIAGNTSLFMGLMESASQFDDILNKPEIVLRQISQRQKAISPSLQHASGLIGGLYGCLELLGGVEGRHLGISAWHTIQEMRNRLMDQVASDSGATSTKLFDNATFENWLTGAIGAQGAVISFRQLIELINSYIYYSVFPNPVGVYKPGTRALVEWPEELFSSSSGTEAGDEAKLVNVDPEFADDVREILSTLREEKGWDGTNKPRAVLTSGFRDLEDRNRIRRQQGKAPLSKSPRSAHDRGFAVDMSIPLGKDEEGKDITLGVMPPRVPASVEEASSTLQKAMAILADNPEITTPAELDASGFLTPKEFEALNLVATFFQDVREAVKGYNISYGGNWLGEERRNPVWFLWKLGWDPVHLQKGTWRDEVAPSNAFSVGANREPEVQAFYESIPARDRLYTQFFRPDIWFAPPPACNVIFPEEVQSFTYTRQMMRETTRLQLTTFNALYESVLLNQVYFAPSFEQVESLAAGGIGSADKAIVYPHEKFSGIIPKLERISEVAFYSRMSEEHQIPAEEVTDELKKEVEEEALSQIERWAARTAAFNFLSHRYAARTAVCTTRFAPRLVCGFPAVVIDKPADPTSQPRDRVTNPLSPTHYLGIIKTLSHSVTQAGGQTSVSMTHARSHKTGDETDDLFAKSIFGDSGKLSVQATGRRITTEIDVRLDMPAKQWAFIKAVESHLLSGGQLSPVPENWLAPGEPPVSGLRGGRVVSIQTSDVPPSSRVSDGGQVRDLVRTTPNGERLLLASNEAGEEEAFSFSSVTVVEVVNEEGGLPLEEALRPPWISDEYSNEQVGRLYEELLGCGSVMDLQDLEPEEGMEIPSVALAVEQIVQNYTAVSDGGAQSSDSFIEAVTRRDFAPLPDVLGTDRQGFYSGSYGPFENLDGEFFSWMREGVTSQVDDTEKKVDGSLDPRKERYSRALTYQTELLRFQGQRG